MKRFAWLAVFPIGLLACGDDGGGEDTADADTGGGNAGFVKPDVTTTAYAEVDGIWTEQGPANWDCLGTPSDDTASTVDITLSGAVNDFQTGDPVPMADIKAFPGVEFDNVLDTASSDVDGNYSMTLPSGQTRVGFLVEADETLPTYALNYYFEPGEAAQSFDQNSVSQLTANALPAFIGVTRTPGLGVLAGAIRDCDGNEVAGAIATVSSTSGTVEHLDGAASYYFSAGSSSLPVRHSQKAYTNSDGLFMIIELPLASEAYMQVWGYLPSQDPATDDLTLLAEIPAPVLADAVITANVEVLRSN